MNSIKNELITKYKEIKARGWIETKRHGDQCLGNTFEDLIGKKEDNKSEADYKGIELKSHRNITHSLITLFSNAPSYPRRANTHLRESYGIDEDNFGKKILNTTMNGLKENSHRGGHSFKAIVNREEERIYIQIKDLQTKNIVDDEIYWSFGVLKKKLEKKIAIIAVLYGDEKNENGKHFVRYTGMRIIEGLTFEKLIKSIEDGKLYIDIRLGVYSSGKYIGKTHDHGTAFRMNLKDLLEIYGNVTVVV